MEVPKIAILGVSPGPSQEVLGRVFADIVFIDRPQDQLFKSQAFQLRGQGPDGQDLHYSPEYFLRSHEDCFLMVGEILSVDAVRRLITLQDGTQVQAKMIIWSTLPEHPEMAWIRALFTSKKLEERLHSFQSGSPTAFYPSVRNRTKRKIRPQKPSRHLDLHRLVRPEGEEKQERSPYAYNLIHS